jgi:hypothetical protein
LPDVVLLPVSEEAHTRGKQGLASALAASSSSVLDQRFADETSSADRSVALVADPLDVLLSGGLGALSNLGLPAGAIVVVPLLPAVSDGEETWGALLPRLAAAGFSAVVGIAPELSPVDRRRLVERLGEESFELVHHSAASASAGDLERRFARAVAAAGLNPFFERPAVAALPPRAERNRRIAALLFEAGERWLALGRGESDAAALFAGARHVDAAPQSIEALARERQLALLPWLSPLARRAVEAFVEAGRSALLEELRAEWVGDGVTA